MAENSAALRAAPDAGRGDFLKKLRKQSWLILIPPALFLLVFLFIPLFRMLALSFAAEDGGFTVEHYVKFFTGNVYIKVILLTLKVSFFVTLWCLILGYPVAYVMTKCSKRVSSLIMIAVMVPFWTSLLVRTYSWMIILQSNGIINDLLLGLGIINEPLTLLHNTTGVYIGMVHILLPYMILSLYPVMQSIDKNLVSAARILGAGKITAFIRVYFPLSVQGISSGVILVFTMGIGYFITPSLLGGNDDAMISQLIQVQVSKLLDWHFSSAVSVILLVISLVILYASRKLMKVDKLW